MTPGGVASKICPQTLWACPLPPCQLSAWYLKAWRNVKPDNYEEAPAYWNYPKWPLTPNSWTPLLSPPPPTNLMIIVSKYYKNPSRHIREEAFYDFGHTDRYTHAIWKLSKFSLFPFALPPPKFWCHHCYYLLINRKLYSSQKKHIFLTSPTHSIIILKSYQTTWTWVFWIYLLCTTAFC